MSYNWIEILRVVGWLALAIGLWYIIRIAIFCAEARRYYFSPKERLLLLKYIMKKRLRLSGFFRSKSALLQVIAVVSGQKALMQEHSGLLERLYGAYTKLEHQLHSASLAKKQTSGKSSTESLEMGMILTVEFTNGCRKNAKVMGKENHALQIRLLDEVDEISDEVIVYFWRSDAGYRFSSKLLRKKGLYLDLQHTRHIQQYVRRAHPRIKLDAPARFFLIPAHQQANYEIERQAAGFECVIRDISEGGAAIIAEGRGQVGLHIKLQFRLGDRDLVMCGTTKDVYYDHEYNQSRIHIQADRNMPFTMKEPILAYVYAEEMNSLGNC
ncbi:PilZ domain-containing protein [Entomospira culicis]|uniref:PilZ domain-containing protein n=1 Tax=Entomospira culicis TaxID=2719989 RepID=A0A968GGI4_9SPIO|nr:PilZ domain-containing protein [Entomospira culicis]NIZ18411.1 PilZ domain-containing protein [Entomospira culicis]NIZ68627.1 PilZ domain-containing protein [Entomospira culicis]WDI37227.1 PilZ domain-containing protein [Entomospira culicis]WDI38855.1 PilZ domain-containing protein [Entomospira culicis]